MGREWVEFAADDIRRLAVLVLSVCVGPVSLAEIGVHEPDADGRGTALDISSWRGARVNLFVMHRPGGLFSLAHGPSFKATTHLMRPWRSRWPDAAALIADLLGFTAVRGKTAEEWNDWKE